MRTEYYENGMLVRVEDDGLPPPAPTERDRWDEITPRHLVVALLAAFRSAGKITVAQQDTMRDAIIEALKR